MDIVSSIDLDIVSSTDPDIVLGQQQVRLVSARLVHQIRQSAKQRKKLFLAKKPE